MNINQQTRAIDAVQVLEARDALHKSKSGRIEVRTVGGQRVITEGPERRVQLPQSRTSPAIESRGRKPTADDVKTLDAYLNDQAAAKKAAEADGFRALQSARTATHERAFTRYLRTGRAERRDMPESLFGTYLVAPSFQHELVQGVQAFGAVTGRARWLFTDNGSPLTVPVATATELVNDSTVIGEDTQVGETDIGPLSQLSFGVSQNYTTGAIRFSRQLVEDAEVDVNQTIAELFAQRIARGLDRLCVTTILANGVSIPVTTTASATAIVLADLASLFYDNIDPALLATPNSALIVAPSTLKYLRTLIVPAGSGSGYPLVENMDMRTVSEDDSAYGGDVNRSFSTPSIWGVPIVTSKTMPVIGATNVTAILGNFDQGFIVRWPTNAVSVLRLEERWADFGQTGFLAYFRADNKVRDPLALALLTQHA